jgi:hypothetical protein
MTYEERLALLKSRITTKPCQFGDENDREGFNVEVRDTDFNWLIYGLEGKDKIIQSYARTIDGMMSDVADIKERLISVLDDLELANTTVRLEEHDESLKDAIKSVAYIIDFLSNIEE